MRQKLISGGSQILVGVLALKKARKVKPVAGPT
jgi:hypothetical protein